MAEYSFSIISSEARRSAFAIRQVHSVTSYFLIDYRLHLLMPLTHCVGFDVLMYQADAKLQWGSGNQLHQNIDSNGIKARRIPLSCKPSSRFCSAQKCESYTIF